MGVVGGFATSHHLLVLLVLVLVLIHLEDGVVVGKYYYEHHDALLLARCEAQCWTKPSKNKCTKLCLQKGFEKAGSCPQNDEIESPFAAICMRTCKIDSQCVGINKCCSHKCGVTCQSPKDLQIAKGLPDIPTDLVVTEKRRKRTIVLRWLPGNAPSATILYVVEQRHYMGQFFSEKRMGEWLPYIRTLKPNAVLKSFVKPGRWYQFRVAAVNANGTKGFSEHSPRFITSAGPRPPKPPQNVTVGPLWPINGTLSAELRWNPPNSDLPIDKYKVFWSRRLHGVAALDSVLVHQRTLSQDATKFLLQNLQPNSLYFLQVQALVQFGRERLKGEKSGLVLNTTNFTNSSGNANAREEGRVTGLRLQKVFVSNGELRARVFWKHRKGVKRYTVSWWNGSCTSNDDDNLQFTLAATTKTPHFDLYHLEYYCRYRVSVREVTPEGMKSIFETSINFNVPSCQELQKKFPQLLCEDQSY